MNNGDHAATVERCARDHERVFKAIDDEVGAIRAIVATLDPVKLLHRAFWESARRRMGLSKESEMEDEHGIDQRMLDYIQAVIVSISPALAQHELTDERWMELREHVRSLFGLFNVNYFLTRSAAARGKEEYDSMLDKLYTQALMCWCNVRGQRYVYHVEQHLRDLVTPHSDELQILFGITGEVLVQGVMNIAHAHTRGLLDAIRECGRLHERWASGVDQSALAKRAEKNGAATALQESVASSGLEQDLRGAFDRAFGYALFDVEKVTGLPPALLDYVCLSPGEDKGFFAHGPHAGWPLRRYPTWWKPLLKVNGRYYCFDLYGVLDRIYRGIQRVITALDPGYAEEWNRKQKAVSEGLPLRLLSTLLPGAVFYPSLHYRWQNPGTAQMEWAEVDGLVLFDDVLITVEVKAGAFLPEPPTPDMEAYLASVKDILFRPAEQGRRLVRTLAQETVVDLFDKPGASGSRVLQLDNKLLRKRFIAAVTLDQLTDIASSIQRRTPSAGALELPVWIVSIDDLRVYADIFDNPLVFCHFLEERHRAYSSPLLDTDDELDHLGLYLRENQYVMYAKQLSPAADCIKWLGYRDRIDEYFHRLFEDASTAERPKQDMPALLEDVLSVLADQRLPGRRCVASHLLDMAGDARQDLMSRLDGAIRKQGDVGTVQPLSTHGDVRITVFVDVDGQEVADVVSRTEYGLACMVLGKEPDRLLLEIDINARGRIRDVAFQCLSSSLIDDSNRVRVQALAAQVRGIRLQAARSRGLGRNDPCPCGSGKKYKRCCISEA